MSPFASKAQQRYLESQVGKPGGLSKAKIKEWETATKAAPGGFKGLPEHVKPKKKPRKR